MIHRGHHLARGKPASGLEKTDPEQTVSEWAIEARKMGRAVSVLAPLTVGDVMLRRYRAVSYSPNGACDLCCVPNVA